jgi:hypothetical protein
MSSTAIRTVFDVITDFLASDPTPDQLIAYHLPDDLQARVDHLVERNGEGQLTFDDQQELLDFMRADEMMALLKAKTKLRLWKTNPCQEPPGSKPVMCTNTKPPIVARTKPSLRIADEKTQAMPFQKTIGTSYSACGQTA